MAQESLFEGLFRSLKANKWATLGIIILSFVATSVMNRSFPTVYESHALLRILSTEEQSGPSLAASMNGILSQKTVLMNVLNAPGLEACDKMTGELFSLEDAGPGLVKLIVRHVNPNLLQPLGDSLVQALSDQFLGFSSEADRFEMEAFEKKKQVIVEKIKETKDDIERSAGLSPEGSELAVSGIEEEIRNQEIKLEESRQRLSTIPKIRVVASQEKGTEYQGLREKLSRQRAQLAELLLSYREKHPKVVKAGSEIRELEKSLKLVSAKKDREEPNPEFDVLLKEVTESEARLGELKNRLDARKSFSQASEAFQIASGKIGESRLKALESMYSDVVLKLENLELKRATAHGKIQVLRKDSGRPKPLGLSLIQRQVIGLVSGALFAAILLYTPLPRKDLLENIQLSNASLMAYGPAVDHDMETMRRIMRVPLLPSPRMGYAIPNAVITGHDERLIVLNEPQSRQLEPFKALLANLQIQLAETGARLLMVCSSRSGMGRTTLVSNLAVLFAQEGYSVILIDANFRKPALHRVFEADNHLGLSNVLMGEADAEVIQKTMVPNLSLITSGPMPANPFEMLGSNALRQFLDPLKERYELVLIDTPALLEYPDARIIASGVSGVVFLSREGEAPNDVRASRDFLQSLKKRVLGFVQT